MILVYALVSSAIVAAPIGLIIWAIHRDTRPDNGAIEHFERPPE